MREIRFRGIYRCLSDSSLHTAYYGIMQKPDLVGAMWVSQDEQFTGLKDKNGREIYDGDILEDVYGNVDSCRWEGCGWIFLNTSGSIDDGEPWEVIGNIHENIELLDGIK